MVPAFSSFADVVPALMENRKRNDVPEANPLHKEQFDSTGLFHWSPARKFEDSILVGTLLLLF